MICTDVPYGKDFLPQVSELAAFAAQGPCAGRAFVTYCGQYWLPEVISALATTLRYRWVITSVWGLVANVVHLDQKQRITSKWKPILVFSKGDLEAGAMDRCFACGRQGKGLARMAATT